VNLRHPYLTQQLIAYIGNKRALLPFFYGVFGRLAEEIPGGNGVVSFTDPFAGSGAVSRLARLMGFEVLANDWEIYSFAINSCFLGVNAGELPELFTDRGGLETVLAELAALPALPLEKCYISRHFAPQKTEDADWRRDRLFYTAENALIIDSIRERIEEMYPGTPEGERAFREKMVLLGPLLYEAATHTNTSGVFKAYHKGFGGHGRDALSRIMARIKPRAPVLVDSPRNSSVFCEDAERFLSSHSSDICYIDPPYASHQYGSNYFMLTTIALWDKPDVSGERGADGRLREKAGIRRDWVRTRSPFCSRATAAEAFRRVVQAADCRYLCASYSDEGLLSLEELADILAATGKLNIYSKEYVKYPGGKQSMSRTARNLELLLVVNRSAKPSVRAPSDHRPQVEQLLLESRFEKLLRSSFYPERIRKVFRVEGTCIVFKRGELDSIALPMRRFHRFEVSPFFIQELTNADKRSLISSLDPCRVVDKREEIDVVLDILASGLDIKERNLYLKSILKLVNGFAHRKYGEAFAETMRKLETLVENGAATDAFREGLDRVRDTAAKRFGYTLTAASGGH
jgi:adenine-specific DNA-methyltransferase